MADKPANKLLFPVEPVQNPLPVNANTQDRKAKVQAQTSKILASLMQALPSNYVSQVTGPYYTIQMQAAAEQLAEFQITAQEVFEDSSYDYLRPEFLFQILGACVFPDAEDRGYPKIEGDLTYREFLKRMVLLLLDGSKTSTLKAGVELLTDATVEVIERGIAARNLRGASAWGPDDMFTLEINVSTADNRFPENDPFTLQDNVRLVLRALKPAHVLYDFRFLFREVFEHLFTETQVQWDFTNYYYEDYRRYWRGMQSITGTLGLTWADRSLFSDVTRDFSRIQAGAELIVLDGPNGVRQDPDTTSPGTTGHYRVKAVLVFPFGPDSTPRAYTRSSGGSGTLVVHEDWVEDQGAGDFGAAVEGETLTILAGPNAGTYRLAALLGPYGHSLGQPVGLRPVPPGYEFKQVRLAPSLLQIEGWMKQVASGQSYTVGVDRLGVQVPEHRQDDVSAYFWL